MDGDRAWVVRISKDGAAAAPSPDAIFDDPGPPGLHFGATHHVVWRSADEAVAVGAWSHCGSHERVPWRDEADGIAVLVGRGFLRGRPPMSTREVVDSLHGRSAGARRSAEPPEDLLGVCAGVAVAHDGSGVLYTDPLGARHLYLAETASATIIGTRSELVARAASSPSTRPAKDALAAAWLGWSRYIVGSATGYTGVRVLEPGTWVRLGQGGSPELMRGRAPWDRADEWRDRPLLELLDSIRAELGEVLELAARCPGATMDLTGGRDSRAMLGVALGAGLAPDLRFRTLGFAGLADVDVATEIAEQFGLVHEVEFPMPTASDDDWLARARRFVRLTGGMINVWDERQRPTGLPVVRVGGFPGEALKSVWTSEKVPSSRPEMQAFLTERLSVGELIRPEVRAVLEGLVTEEALPHDGSTTGVRALLDRFAGRNIHRYRLGPLVDLEVDVRILPFTSGRLLERAFAVRSDARLAELTHYYLTVTGSAALASHRFAGAGWNARRLEPFIDELDLPALPSPSSPPASEATQPVAPPGKAESLVARFKRSVADDRFDRMREVLSDRSNPVWDVADQHATLRALDEVSTLSKRKQNELYGVVTGALWLGEQ